MTKRWKLKTNSSNILLVLITLILVKAEWTAGELDNSIEEYQPSENYTQIYVGNDEIAQFFFKSSSSNESLILENVNQCLDNFQLITCLKMLLLERITTVESLLKGVSDRNLYFFDGLVSFERKNQSLWEPEEKSESLSLDEEIVAKVVKLFRNRSLKVNLLSRVKLEIEPVAGQNDDDFVCFSYKLQRETKASKDNEEKLEEEGREKKQEGMSMMSVLPPLLMLGFMPFTLASLKAMVMNAVMINMMALNGAIFMTIRNLVFGPRCGGNVKYVNYGYSANRQTQSKKPVLIVHSPAAFVKQPEVHKKPHRYPVHYANAGTHHHKQFSGQEYYVKGNLYHTITHSSQRRNERRPVIKVKGNLIGKDTYQRMPAVSGTKRNVGYTMTRANAPWDPIMEKSHDPWFSTNLTSSADKNESYKNYNYGI